MSLAPSTASNHSFSVIEWARGGEARIVLSLPNAHPPGGALGVLGYVADAVNQDVYVALVVHKALSLTGDSWEIVLLDRTSGIGGAIPLLGSNFNPLGAETISVSGVGIKK